MGGAPEEAPTALVRALYAALATSDRGALDRLLHSDFVGETTPGLPLSLGGRHDGPRAMRRFWAELGRAFDVTAEPADIQLISDGRVLVTGVYVGAARSTGIKFRAWFTHTITVREGQIAGLVQLTDSQQWVAALTAPAATTESAATTDATPAATTNATTTAATSARTLTAVSCEVAGGIAQVRLERPAAANAINADVTADLRAIAEALKRDSRVRVVLLTGAGTHFCAGGDIGLFSGTPHDQLPALLKSMIGDYHVALRVLSDLAAPVVCAVQGAAAGGGLGLLYASDVVIAADDAKFALGYGALGLTFDGGSSWHLPRLVGPARAALMYLENSIVGAAEALSMGLISEVVPADTLGSRASSLAERLAAGPTTAFGQARRLLRQGWTATLEEQLARERQTIVQVAATEDAAEGLAAFVARRTPLFTGT